MGCENVTLYSRENSMVESYAQENNISFFAIKNPLFTLGDLDGDGEVKTSDILLLQKFIAKSVILTQRQQAADVDQNGTLSTNDVLLLQKYIAKMIEHF